MGHGKIDYVHIPIKTKKNDCLNPSRVICAGVKFHVHKQETGHVHQMAQGRGMTFCPVHHAFLTAPMGTAIWGGESVS